MHKKNEVKKKKQLQKKRFFTSLGVTSTGAQNDKDTQNEQLVLLKSRCSLITFMPNKPNRSKYGTKFWVSVDVKARYVVNITPYLSEQEKEGRCGVSLGESVVINISEHIKEKECNTCCDSFFHIATTG